MSSWRQDVKTINQKLTGELSGNWRLALLSISPNSTAWRQAIRTWAGGYGIPASSWREDIKEICKIVTGISPTGWRDAFRILAESDFDMEVAFFISPPPRQQNTIYRVLVDGIITADGQVMA